MKVELTLRPEELKVGWEKREVSVVILSFPLQATGVNDGRVTQTS